MAILGGAVSAVVGAASKAFTSFQDRKKAKTQGLIEIQRAQVDGVNTLNLNKAQWEVVTASLLGGTWKDEWVTVTILSPYAMIFIGAIPAAFGYPQGLAAAGEMLTILNEISKDSVMSYSELSATVALAALGVRLFK